MSNPSIRTFKKRKTNNFFDECGGVWSFVRRHEVLMNLYFAWIHLMYIKSTVFALLWNKESKLLNNTYEAHVLDTFSLVLNKQSSYVVDRLPINIKNTLFELFGLIWKGGMVLIHHIEMSHSTTTWIYLHVLQPFLGPHHFNLSTNSNNL